MANLLGFLCSLWLIGAAFGVIRYFTGRMTGKIGRPQPSRYGAALGRTRLAVGACTLLALLLALLSTDWTLAHLVACFALVCIAMASSPEAVTKNQGTWWAFCAVAAGVPAVLAISVDVTAFDRLLWVGLGVVALAIISRRFWAASGYLGSVAPLGHGSTGQAQTGPQGGATQGQGQGQQPKAMRKHLIAPSSWEVVSASLRNSIAGQDEAITRLFEILRDSSAVFRPDSTRPLVLAFIGPDGVGKHTMAHDLANLLAAPVRLGSLMQPMPGSGDGFVNVYEVDGELPAEASAYWAEMAKTGITPDGLSYRRGLVVLLLDADAVSDDPDSLREQLVQSGLDAELAYRVDPVRFCPLASRGLAGVAARCAYDLSLRAGLHLQHIESAALVHILRSIPRTTRGRGAAAVPLGVERALGRRLEEMRAFGLRRISLGVNDNGITLEKME